MYTYTCVFGIRENHKKVGNDRPSSVAAYKQDHMEICSFSLDLSGNWCMFSL